jgi:hypothetical protein
MELFSRYLILRLVKRINLGLRRNFLIKRQIICCCKLSSLKLYYYRILRLIERVHVQIEHLFSHPCDEDIRIYYTQLIQIAGFMA